LLLTIEGDARLDGWLTRNKFGALDASNDLLARFQRGFAFDDYSRVTLVGIGAGGLPTQWIAAAAASRSPAFVNVQLINSPDISGLISQVVRSDFPEYEHGARSLATNFIVESNDWVSQIGIWSGESRVRATWKAYSFEYDPAASPKPLSQLDELRHAHSPAPGSVDFSKLQVSDLRLAHINSIVHLEDTDDFLQAVANVTTTIDGLAYDSTVSALDVLIDDASLSSVSDQEIDEGARQRAAFRAQLRHDSLAVAAKPLSASYDFGTVDSPYDPSTSFQITPESRYPGVAAGVLAAGWQSTTGLKAVDRGRATNLERDAILVGDGVFLINVKPGTYNIAVTYGDRDELRESVQLYLNGVVADRVTTMPGDFLTRTYQVTAGDGLLSLRFADLGGKTDVAAIAGVSLEQVNFGSELPITEAMESDPAVIVMLEDYELPETSAGIEILKTALIAAATAVLTVGAGALLGMTQIGGSIAAGLGGHIASASVASGSSIVVAGTGEMVRAGIVAGFKATIGAAIKDTVLTSLLTSIPPAIIPNDTFRGMWSAGLSLFEGIQDIHAGAPHLVDGIPRPRDWLVQANGSVKSLTGGLAAVNTVLASIQSGDDEQMAPWLYDVANSFSAMSRGFRAGRIDPAFVPVDVDDVLQAVAAGKSGKKLLRNWPGSRNFLVPNWLPDGEELTDVSEEDHRAHVRRGSRVIVSLLSAYTETLRKTAPGTKLDVLFVAAGAAYDLAKEVTTRLNESDIAQALDFVKIVTLDPVTFGEDTAKVYHPELNPLISAWDNVFQHERTPAGDLYHVGSSPGTGALDDRLRGGPAGAYNQKGRLFDVQTGEEVLRFGHWNRNSTQFASAEMTDTEYSPDGRWLATSDKGGNVTVRYAADQLEPQTGRILHPLGEVAFTVYGQDSFVRSVSFAQIEVKSGVWEEYLLTVSSPVDPRDAAPERNKVLMTELKTGRPVWQGYVRGGTQAEISPSGNLLVTTDRDGDVTAWRRNPDEATSFSEVARRKIHSLAGGAYITDLQVLNDRYFVTAGLDGKLNLSRMDESLIAVVQELKFAGEVRNIAFDPYNGILAVGAGNETSLWRFELDQPRLTLMSGGGTALRFTHHVAPVQGVAFNKPAFLFDSLGHYRGDRDLPRTELGDVDRRQLPRYVSERKLPGSLVGLKLATGGEDRTVLVYSLQRIDQGLPREERAIAGGMLPIRELSLSPDGRFVALVGQDNIDGDYGGFINDIDVTGSLDSRLGWTFAEVFMHGRREHNAVPQEYLYQAEIDGESFFYLRNSGNANQPGQLDRSRRLDLPPNKRIARPGVDVEPITIEARPGSELEIRPRRYLIEADRDKFSLQRSSRLRSPCRMNSDASWGRSIENAWTE
jgi:WD40 repeat protein